MSQHHFNHENDRPHDEQSALDALKAAEMTRALEVEPQKQPSSVLSERDLSLDGLSNTSSVESFAERLKLTRQAPQHGFERCFDLAVNLMDAEPRPSAFYEIFRNTSHNSMADSFLSSLPGLDITNLKEQLDRSWGTYLLGGLYLFGGDQGRSVSLEGESLPEWLSVRLRALREALGADYAVELVAHRPAGKSSTELSVGLKIECRTSAPTQQTDPQAEESTAEPVGIPSPIIKWEAVTQSLKNQGFSDREVAIEQELRERIDIKTIIAELERKRDALLEKGRLYPDNFGNVGVAEVALAQLKVELPKRTTLATLSLSGAAVYAAAFCLSGFNHHLAFTFSMGVSPFTMLGGLIAAETYFNSKLSRFHPWQRSPHLQELGRVLTEKGFVWELSDKLPVSDDYPMPLTLTVAVRDTSVKMT